MGGQKNGLNSCEAKLHKPSNGVCRARIFIGSRAPADEAQELATSRAFIQWYQKLLAYRAGETMTGVNAQISKLGNALPTAAKILEAAMAEADAEAVA